MINIKLLVDKIQKNAIFEIVSQNYFTPYIKIENLSQSIFETISLIDIVDFDISSGKIIIWTSKELPLDMATGCTDYIPGPGIVIKSPTLELLYHIWNKNEKSHKIIKQFITTNKIINGNDEERNWLMSIILGEDSE